MPDMPTFEKPAAELVERFNTLLDRLAGPEVTRRPMFGHPCAWVGGNMATGLFAQSWWVRLTPERLAEVYASGEGRPFQVIPGRDMRGYSVLPDDVVADDARVDAWITEALATTAALPPKEPKARKEPRARKA